MGIRRYFVFRKLESLSSSSVISYVLRYEYSNVGRAVQGLSGLGSGIKWVGLY